MTDRQFDLLMMHSGMRQDGLASSEAIAYMTLMAESAENIVWLVKHIKASEEARKATQ